MRRFWTFSRFLTLALITAGSVGCAQIANLFGISSDDPNLVRVESQNQNGRPSTEAIGNQSLTSEGALINEEAGVLIEIPPSWSSDRGLNEAAVLQASDAENDLYLIVVAESASSLRRPDLDANAAQYRNLLAQQLANYQGASKTDVAFVGANFAQQYEIRGTLADGTPVVYLHTTVFLDDTYYQIVGWTTPEQYPAYRSELQNITETFQEITP